MKIAQEINTQRALTIAGSVALLAITAYGVWKWNHSDLPPPGNNEDEKKKKPVAHDKVEKQSREVETVTQIEVEETDKEEIIKVKEVKETVESDRVILETSESIVAIDKFELEDDLKKELEQLTSEEYVVVPKETETTEATAATATTTTTVEENHSCATSSTEETDIWTPEHEITTSNDVVVDQKKNTPETKSSTTEEYIWKADSVTSDATNTPEDKSNEEWATNAAAVASAIVGTPAADAAAAAAAATEKSTIAQTSTLSYTAPVFVPRQQSQAKKNTKKRLSRAELIEQQRQNHTPHAKARCSHWPRCTNKNCKFWHPFRDCREGETCPFGNKCMFIHPSDYVDPPRPRKNQQSSSDEEDQSQYIHNSSTDESQQQKQFYFSP